jgi:hypothetical protein
MCVFKYHAFIYFLRPLPWYGTHPFPPWQLLLSRIAKSYIIFMSSAYTVYIFVHYMYRQGQWIAQYKCYKHRLDLPVNFYLYFLGWRSYSSYRRWGHILMLLPSHNACFTRGVNSKNDNRNLHNNNPSEPKIGGMFKISYSIVLLGFENN